ncbi:efflux RND transporter periplasmic adaptor subunit [Salinisphaera sp. LB1]|uniref:efflux RND transporter periplasmic adaptor subunit n=1 Tax=Salinisphaera sp. LB1 TaxID=2183911 RepID=UPI000D7D7AF4|nr:efflux RND transporter periplasmic adaptor subunit [Salinisphaera sp. LB1]AWN14575.1 RND efflux system, membrane fusion protein CmeA [Salinisphaera sp. LB1]
MRNNDYDAPKGAWALRALIILVSTLAVTACGSSSGESQAQGQQPPPTPVQALTVKPHAVDVYGEYPGRVQGKQTAKVIGQVTGVLQAKHYREGAVVQKGDPLFTIDPKPYQATVNQRKAQLASAKAALANATRVWHRTRKLYKENAVSQATRDQDLSTYQSDKAAVQQAKANLQSARINLDYTHVEAPISGVTSLRDVDLGSLVTANQTQLTTITQINPVYVLFALPENDAFARQKALHARGKDSNSASMRQATIILGNGKDYSHKGEVDFTQSTIDPQTGTVSMRATVKNPDNRLMPGLYVRVRVRIATLSKGIVVPEKAVFTGQSRTYVYVVDNGKAKKRFVKLGPSVADGRVISKGLSGGDQVIVSGLGAIKPGAPVKVKTKSNDKSGKEQASANPGQTDMREAS